MHELSSLDKAILNILQKDFPLDVQPFRLMAEKLNCSEDDLLNRVQRMKKDGVIRRIGAVLDARSLGFYSTLCACRVPAERIEEVAAIINKENGVTHNYLRDHDLNIWFTLTAPSFDEAMQIKNRMENDIGLNIISMPTTKVFKIKVSFEMGDTNAI
ncbi:MAG: Lrp/AsnC family transcriptional regulator [Syntrophomonas sp.]